MRNSNGSNSLISRVYYLSWIILALGNGVFTGPVLIKVIREYLASPSWPGLLDVLLYAAVFVVLGLAILFLWLSRRGSRPFLWILSVLSIAVLVWQGILAYWFVSVYLFGFFGPGNIVHAVIAVAGFIVGVLIVWTTVARLKHTYHEIKEV